MTAIALALWLALQLSSPKVTSQIEAALKAKQEGRYDDAIEALRNVLAVEPSLWAAHASLGETYYLKRDYERAAPSLSRALELKPGQPGVEGMLGVALLAQGRAADAVPHLERGSVLDALGVALLELGRVREAVEKLESARAKRPGDPDILFHLGQAYGRLSREAFDEVAANHPDSARARQIRAEGFAATGRSDLAEAEYRELLRMQPGLPGVHLALGELHFAAGDFEQAVQDFAAEKRVSSRNARVAFRLGMALLRMGRAEEGLREITAAAQLQPDSPEILYELGRAGDQLSDTALAEKAWLRVITLDDSGGWAEQAHYQISQLYRRLGNKAGADEHLQMFQRLQRRRSRAEP